MEQDPHREEPLDVEVFYPESVELIDPQRPDLRSVSAVRPRRLSRLRLAALLFVGTCLSTLYAGGPYYAAAIMSILLAHEMGHYLQARRYGVPASFPYFLPFPISPLGTMGAVIVQGAGVANRKMLFDIAVSGPLAGLLIALPVTYYGIRHATFVPRSAVLATVDRSQSLIFGEPLIYTWMIRSIHGTVSKDLELLMGPFAFAGWVGIFITALNLIPIGQLDGGHILYTLIGRPAHLVARLLLFGAIGYMIYSRDPAYGLMAALLFLMGPRHPPTANDSVPLGWPRIVLGWLTLAFIIIGFTPHPISQLPIERAQEERPRHNVPKPRSPIEHRPDEINVRSDARLHTPFVGLQTASPKPAGILTTRLKESAAAVTPTATS